MHQAEKYPYALFMGHLALEKLLKAICVRSTKQHAPITHSLEKIAKKSKIDILADNLMKLRDFMEFHFEARYPSEQSAFYKKCTKTYTKRNLKEIKEVFKWLKNRL